MKNNEIESKFITVKEIAEKTGTTRNVVWSYIRKHKIKVAKKVKNKNLYDKQIVSKIKLEMKNKQNKNNSSEVNNSVSENVFKILEKQLEDKQRVIEKQQETIDYFKKENIALRFENNRKQKLLEDSQKKQEAISENDLKTKQETYSKHWWQRIFNR